MQDHRCREETDDGSQPDRYFARSSTSTVESTRIMACVAMVNLVAVEWYPQNQPHAPPCESVPDPLTDISNVTKIDSTVVSGQRLDRAQLDQLFDDAKTPDVGSSSQ